VRFPRDKPIKRTHNQTQEFSSCGLKSSSPDQLYRQAQSAATAHGLSVDRYMTDVLKDHLREAQKNSDALTLNRRADQQGAGRAGGRESRTSLYARGSKRQS
jgi:hypothetical protein